MLTLTGTVIHAFTTPQGEAKDGTKYGGVDKVQLVVKRTLRNGETVMQQHDLTVSDKDYYLDRIGQSVSINVEPFAMQNGQSVPIRFKTVEG
jgi:hypothetical protein